MTTATLNPKMQLCDDEGDYELFDGIPKEKPPMGLFANLLASFLASAINQYSIPRKLGIAVNETTHKVNDRNSRRPDISYVETEKLPSIELLLEDPPHLECAPNLAIEVISPSNRAIETAERIIFYFNSGVQLVWIIYPPLRRIHVYESADGCAILHGDDVLSGGKVIPGFSIKVAELFDMSGLTT